MISKEQQQFKAPKIKLSEFDIMQTLGTGNNNRFIRASASCKAQSKRRLLRLEDAKKVRNSAIKVSRPHNKRKYYFVPHQAPLPDFHGRLQLGREVSVLNVGLYLGRGVIYVFEK
jgi:hypothetical protein